MDSHLRKKPLRTGSFLSGSCRSVYIGVDTRWRVGRHSIVISGSGSWLSRCARRAAHLAQWLRAGR